MGAFVRKLVEDIRQIVRQGSVEAASIDQLEQLVAISIPRLQRSRLCTEGLKPGRYLCYRDADYGFVVMLLVWGPGDMTAIHDHGVWGVEAVLKNTLKVIDYCASEENPQPLESKIITAGAVMHNLPPARDVHKVEHYAGEGAVSLHIYGREMTNNRQFIPGVGFKSCSLGCRDLCSDLKRDFEPDVQSHAAHL